ncbi:MAG TPA: TlpA disulfide reductase family protein [Candidatus Binataceae bacterium]|nr:TlpA disulfide reductase family protein [Candidatus Binataceae bacterium]
MHLKKLLLTIGLLLLTVGSAGSPASASADVGQPAPALVVDEIGGSKFDLSALRGKVVIINFWATWCPPCRKEMPALEAFYKQYHAKGVEMIGVSADRPHDRRDVESAAKSLSYPVAMLEDAKDNGFEDPSSLPETFVVDRSGVIRAKFLADENGLSEESLTAAVQPLLQAQPPNASSTY